MYEDPVELPCKDHICKEHLNAKEVNKTISSQSNQFKNKLTTKSTLAKKKYLQNIKLRNRLEYFIKCMKTII